MKKTLLLLLAGVFAFTALCNVDAATGKDMSEQNPGTTWQDQLEYVKNRDKVKSGADADDIYLAGYAHRGKMSSEADLSAVLDEMFSDDSYIVMYTSTDRSTFEIVTIKTFKEKTFKDPSIIKSQFADLVNLGGEIDVIDLEWNYKGKTYYSIAIADNNNYRGIIHENIGCLIIEPDKRGKE